jgi:hypothetical protein
MVQTTSLETARTWPGTKDTVDSSLFVTDLTVFNIDWTDTFNSVAASNSTTLANLVSTFCGSQGLGINAGQTALQTALVNAIASASTVGYNITAPASTQYSLYGIVAKQYSLPNAAVPEADSKYFNNCVVLDVPAANSWGTGRMILHYNV